MKAYWNCTKEQLEEMFGFREKGLTEEEVEAIISKIIAETGASGIASMGKVMGLATAKIGGQAEGKVISGIVKKLLV